MKSIADPSNRLKFLCLLGSNLIIATLSQSSTNLSQHSACGFLSSAVLYNFERGERAESSLDSVPVKAALHWPVGGSF